MSDNQLSPRDKETMLALKTKELALREKEIEIEAQKQKRGLIQLVVLSLFGLLVVILVAIFLLRDSTSNTAVVNPTDNADEQTTAASNMQIHSTATAQAITLANAQAANDTQSLALQETATAQVIMLNNVQATNDTQMAIIAATSTTLAQVIPTVAPMPTLTSAPTSIPTVIPTAIVASETNDTPINAVLKPGESWYVNELEIVLENPTFNPGCSGSLGFEIVIRNKSGNNKKIESRRIYISDDKSNNYENIYFKTGVASPACYSNTLGSFQIGQIESDSYKDYAFRSTMEMKKGINEIIVMIPEVYERISPRWSIDIVSGQ